MLEKSAGDRLYSAIASILMKAGVPEPEVDACLDWAFGRGCLYVAPAQWPARWNKLHPKSVHIAPRDKFVEIIFIVGTYYVILKKKAEIARNN